MFDSHVNINEYICSVVYSEARVCFADAGAGVRAEALEAAGPPYAAAHHPGHAVREREVLRGRARGARPGVLCSAFCLPSPIDARTHTPALQLLFSTIR